MNGLQLPEKQNVVHETKFSTVRPVLFFAYLAMAADALEPPVSLTAKFVNLRVQASDNFH